MKLFYKNRSDFQIILPGFCSNYSNSLFGRQVWFRIFRRGLSFKSSSALRIFSERNGFKKSVVILGVRIVVLDKI